MYFWYPQNQLVKKNAKLLLKTPNIQKIENQKNDNYVQTPHKGKIVIN